MTSVKCTETGLGAAALCFTRLLHAARNGGVTITSKAGKYSIKLGNDYSGGNFTEDDLITFIITK